ncbi:protein AMEIOTIC 1-like [Zingiber officinale]|uniref:protein AMEIOTIC 1-like n=1 Tax=Zingiber officinale TaxID=94328 RepID=UPI001C4BFE16|nr:protein AMEIOTIC 1-like [Zingiber officinale]
MVEYQSPGEGFNGCEELTIVGKPENRFDEKRWTHKRDTGKPLGSEKNYKGSRDRRGAYRSKKIAAEENKVVGALEDAYHFEISFRTSTFSISLETPFSFAFTAFGKYFRPDKRAPSPVPVSNPLARSGSLAIRPKTLNSSFNMQQVKYYYSKRNDSSTSKERKGKWALSKQQPPEANSGHASLCNGTEFQLGAFFEIDHEKLPPKSPIQLKAIRVVKVSEATRLEVTVSFPSTLALRNYFALSPETGRDPELDERFVMSSNQAGRILWRLVSPSEVEEQKHLESFWLSCPNLHEHSPTPVITSESVAPQEEEAGEGESVVGHCLLTMIKCSGLVQWGIRRKVKYIGRHRQAEMSVDGHEEEVEEDVQDDVEEEQSERKRKREIAEDEKKNKKKKKKGKKNEKKWPEKRQTGAVKRNTDKKRSGEERQYGKGTKDRWSTERYEAAELKLLEIMKTKGAALGKPIMRQTLREEARKHIGDTGLLDHLLKHMAGKVVTNGAERFRRRHNSEGAMEYWLEPADLVDVRKMAGVSDTYWVPPPGWKPGDAMSDCPCGGDCKSKTQLKEEIATLKREINQLWSLKNVDNENYKCWVERNQRYEEEINNLTNFMHLLKEEILQLREEKENKKVAMEAIRVDKGLQCGEDHDSGTSKQEENLKNMEMIDHDDGTTEEEKVKAANYYSGITISSTNDTVISSSNRTSTKTKNSATTNSKKVTSRRSGFRICKPQGTFLWPDMSASAAAVSTIEEHMMLMGSGVPTPHSASSATSAPRLLLLPSPTSAARPAMTARPSEIMTVPTPAPPAAHFHHLQQAGGSYGLYPASVVYHHTVARVWAQTTSTSPPAMLVGVEGNNRAELAAAMASWDAAHRDKGGRGSVTTDLALAPPSTATTLYP